MEREAAKTYVVEGGLTDGAVEGRNEREVDRHEEEEVGGQNQ